MAQKNDRFANPSSLLKQLIQNPLMLEGQYSFQQMTTVLRMSISDWK